MAEESSDFQPPVPMGQQKLARFGELWKATFDLYQRRAKVLWMILLAPIGLQLIVNLILLVDIVFAVPQGLSLAFSFFSVILFLVAGFLGFWAGLAMLFAIKEEISAKEAFRQAWGKLGSYVWLTIISILVIMGGTFLFFVPGIIFSVQFTFIYYILVVEGLTGKEAILKSREYVKGYWGAVLGKQLLLALAVIGIMLLPMLIIFVTLALTSPGTMGFNSSGTMATQQEMILNFLMLIIQILIAPISAIFGFLLYQDVKAKKANLVFVPTQKQKTALTLWAVWAMVAWIVLCVFIIGSIIFAWINLKQGVFTPDPLNFILPKISSMNINTQWFSALINSATSLWH